MNRKKGNSLAKQAGRYHHGELREALLQTALRFVEERGVEALTLRELARRVGVSHAAPAHHFPDKIALLVALAVEGFRRFAQALDEAAAGAPDPAQRLTTIGRAYVHFALAHPGYFHVMFGSQLSALECPPDELDEASRGGYRVLEQCVDDLIGGNDPARVQQIALAAWSFTHGVATLYLDGPLRFQLGTEQGRRELELWLDSTLPLMGRTLASGGKEA